MAVKNIKTIRPYVWIPPKYNAQHRITVERSDGTVDDITDIAFYVEIEDGATDNIGRFEFIIWNPSESYTGVWTGMEIFRYYCDYATTATTLRFRGRIEKPAYTNNQIRCSGRSESLKLQDITVTKSYNGFECSTILKDLFDSYATDFTYTNVNVSSVNITVDWYQKPFLDCVNELCTSAGFSFYIDSSLDAHFFESGSVTNTNEGFVQGMNMFEIGEFADDSAYVKNRVIVYGATQDDTQTMYTAEDFDSQDSYGVMEKIVNNSNITSYEQAKDYGDYVLSTEKDPPQTGEVTGTLLATIQPGEKIRLSSPMNNLPPGDYNIISYKHKIDFDEGMTTTVNVNKEPKRFSHVLSKMIESDNLKSDTNSNPYEMRFSYNFLFNEDTGTHSDTEITDGLLKPTAASGTWISPTRELNSNITQAYLIINGELKDNITVYVSGNDGVYYEIVGNRSKIDLTSSIGKLLKVKVVFSDADARLNSLSIQYKTT